MLLRHPLAAFGVTAALFAGLAPVAAQDAAPPVAVAARLVDEGGAAKLVFDLSSGVEGGAHAWPIRIGSSSTSRK